MNTILETQVAWIRYQRGHGTVLNDRVTKQAGLPALPAVDVMLYKGKMRKETTSEDRRKEGCQNHDKARPRRLGKEVSNVQLGIHRHRRSELWTLLAGQGQWLCSWGVLAPPSPSFIPTAAAAACTSERATYSMARVDQKDCSACCQDLVKTLCGRRRKGKEGRWLSGHSRLQEAELLVVISSGYSAHPNIYWEKFITSAIFHSGV